MCWLSIFLLFFLPVVIHRYIVHFGRFAHFGYYAHFGFFRTFWFCYFTHFGFFRTFWKAKMNY